MQQVRFNSSFSCSLAVYDFPRVPCNVARSLSFLPLTVCSIGRRGLCQTIEMNFINVLTSSDPSRQHSGDIMAETIDLSHDSTHADRPPPTNR